jgi:hypothetical protein
MDSPSISASDINRYDERRGTVHWKTIQIPLFLTFLLYPSTYPIHFLPHDLYTSISQVVSLHSITRLGEILGDQSKESRLTSLLFFLPTEVFN